LIARAGTLGKLGKALLNRAVDAGVSAGSQYAKDGEVSLTDVAIDVAAGKLVGDAVGKRAARTAANSAEGKVLERAADRTERIAAQSSREAKQTAAEKARAAQRDHVASAQARSSVTASNAASAMVEIMCVGIKKKECD
jgi:hypothetical protein